MRPPRCPPLRWVDPPPKALVFLSGGYRRAPFWRLLIRYRSRRVCATCGRSPRPGESPRSLFPWGHVPESYSGDVTVIDKCGQALKGVWWMSWHREAKKDVVACDKLREAGNQASIRRFLNAETRSR